MLNLYLVCMPVFHTMQNRGRNYDITSCYCSACSNHMIAYRVAAWIGYYH